MEPGTSKALIEDNNNNTFSEVRTSRVNVIMIQYFCCQFWLDQHASCVSWFIQNLSSLLFLNELRDGTLTTSDDKLFHILTILQLKIFSQVIMTSGVCQFKRIVSSSMH